MIHAHEKYNRIQDPENKIGEDEPVFLLRAKDKFAPATLRFWASRVAEHGNEQLALDIYAHADAMVAWQQNNICQIPD